MRSVAKSSRRLAFAENIVDPDSVLQHLGRDDIVRAESQDRIATVQARESPRNHKKSALDVRRVG
jgi:hypothetical protein